MKSKHLVHPDILRWYNGELPIVKLNSQNLIQMREFFANMAKRFYDPSSEGVKITKERIAGPDPGQELNLLIYQPEDKNGSIKPGILHMHSGGFVIGSAEMNENFCKKLAHDSASVVISVDYRLAPETRFPGALEDCYQALLWMSRESQKLGIDATKLAITGESAGASLAASLAFLIRDRKEVSIVLQFLTYPMLDDRTGLAMEPSSFLGEFSWTEESNCFAWTSYLGHAPGTDATPYPAAPARIEDLSGLAPTFIVCGALDLFLPENLNYAIRLMKQGIPTGVRVYPGATHGFFNLQGTELSNAYFEEHRSIFKKYFA